MKNSLKTGVVALCFVFLAACGKGSQHDQHNSEGMVQDDPNKALYDQVMTVHNESMRRDEIFQLVKALKDKAASDPDNKIELEKTIAELDSADYAMMDWMHKFKDPDYTKPEAAREYLEDEMEKINKVKELVNGSIQKAKEQLGKK